MEVHNISINRKYFEPIRDGTISLLIFKKKVIHNGKIGDYILASFGSYDVKAKISGISIKAFEDITEKEARMAGFLNKDFLKDNLISEFDLKSNFNVLSSLENIDDELFFLVELKIDEDHTMLNNWGYDETKVTLYSKDFNKEFYNPEYDTKPWSYYYEKEV